MSLNSSRGTDNDSFSKLGMLLVIGSFIVTLGFFGYVLSVNPGPIDTGVFDVVALFTKSQADERTNSWKALTPENISYGEQVYKVNCNLCHAQTGKDIIVDRLVSGSLKYGNTPLALYKTVRKGFDNQHRLDYFPEHEKWAVIAFMRSKIPNAPDDSSSAWKQFLKEGMY